MVLYCHRKAGKVLRLDQPVNIVKLGHQRFVQPKATKAAADVLTSRAMDRSTFNSRPARVSTGGCSPVLSIPARLWVPLSEKPAGRGLLKGPAAMAIRTHSSQGPGTIRSGLISDCLLPWGWP